MPVIARLRPGVSFAEAQAEMDTVSARLANEFPAEKGWLIQQVRPLQQAIVGDVKSPLLILSCAVGLVLLIACANIANLLLTRATSRSREIAVRIALGAPKRRITRQLLTESAILGIFGSVAGMFLAYWGVSALVSLLPPGLPRIHGIRVDGSVLGFALVLSMASSFVFGLAPVLFAVRSDPQTNLREGARAGEATGSRRARSFLAAIEVALAMVLLVGAGLLMRSFVRLTSVSPGFEPSGVVKAMVSLPQFQYSTQQQWTAFATELMTRLPVSYTHLDVYKRQAQVQRIPSRPVGRIRHAQQFRQRHRLHIRGTKMMPRRKLPLAKEHLKRKRLQLPHRFSPTITPSRPRL